MKEKTENPMIFVIFGATGDLSNRYLLPALFNLSLKNILHKNFKIVGFSGRELSNDDYREFVKKSIKKAKYNIDNKKIDKFLKNIFYKQGKFEEQESYYALSKFLINFDEESGQCSDKIFYLAVPPILYDSIFNNLANSGLSIPCGGDKGFNRVLVEKPFGKDIKTARKLDKKLGLLFKEDQIFRIDHYMAKEAMQNILAFRFSNNLFGPLWNNKYIEKIEINFFEKLGIENRGAFYNDVGALRDVGQNHILQMLAFIAMENPKNNVSNKWSGLKNEANAIRSERTKVLKKLRKISIKDIDKYVERAQYIGFKKENFVSNDSETETYFSIKAYIDNKRWRGVPFYLRGGKKMKETKIEIIIYFKNTQNCLCKESIHNKHQNILTFNIKPDENINILFWVKKPGVSFDLEYKELSFSYSESFNGVELLDAYQKVLFDAISGDQTLFNSTEEVEALWKFITPILKNWKKLKLSVY